MDFTNCKGIQAKKYLTNKYFITPLTYVKLLNNQTRMGCCGKITDKYYVFSYENKNDENEKGNFYTGSNCANQFFELLGIKNKFKLFNPFHQIKHKAYNKPIRYDNGYKNLQDQLNQEIFNAINLLFCSFESIPYNAKINQILDFITRVNIKTKDWAVIEVNNLISQDSKNRNLDKIVSDINEENDIREFSFPKMKKIITTLIQSGEVVRNNIGELD